MGFVKIDTSKYNRRFGRGAPPAKARQVKTFDTPSKNRAPDIPKTEAKEGDVLSYFDDTKGKVLTSFDGGYQSSNTAKVSDMSRFDQGQFVTSLNAGPNARVRTRGEIHASAIKEAIIGIGDGNIGTTKTDKYFDYVADSTCDTTDGSHTIACDSTNIVNGKIKIGMNVVGTGIPEHAVVKSLPSTTSFTIGTYIGEDAGTQPSAVSNVNATADGTNVTLYFYGTILYLDGSRYGHRASSVFIDNGNEWYKNTIAGIVLPRTGDEPSQYTEIAGGASTRVTLYFAADDFAIRCGKPPSADSYGSADNSNSAGKIYEVQANGGHTYYHSPYEFVNGHMRWNDTNIPNGTDGDDVITVVLETTANSASFRIVSAERAPNQRIGHTKHRILTKQLISYAHSSDNTVAMELKNTKLPANSIITEIAARVNEDSNLGTHKVNIQMSATSGTAADSSISSGTELLGAGVTNTDSSDSASATDIDLNQAGDTWICRDTVRVGSSDQYLYVCNAGTGNGTTNPSSGALEIIVEYYGSRS